MLFSKVPLARAGALFVITGLTACGGATSIPNASNGGTAVTQSLQGPTFALGASQDDSWMDPAYAAGIGDGTKPVLYVADYNAGVINIYPATGKAKKPIGQIKGVKGPNGLAVDSHRNLYVTENSAGDVLVYPGGNVKKRDVLNDAGHSPESVSVADDGTVYVANHDYPQTGTNIQVYKNYKSKNPTSTLSDASIAYPYYVAVDKAGNVYLTYTDQGSQNDIGEFPFGSTTLKPLFTATPNFQGIGVDPKGNLLADDLVGKAIDLYAPGAKSPTSSIPLVNGAQSFALTSTARDLYTADFSSNTVSDYSYPAGKLIETITDKDEHWGVATSPAAPLGTWHP